MAFGLTPKYTQDLGLDGLTAEQYMMLALYTAEAMKWQVGYVSENSLKAYTNQGMFKRNAIVEINIYYDIVTIISTSTGSEMFDLGKNRKNVEAFIAAFAEQKALHTAEELDSRYQALKEENIIVEAKDLERSEKNKSFFSLFIPKPGFFITPILIDLNILLFILMVASGVNILEPDTDSLIKWGANFRPYTLDGQWWRLFTNFFLHIGIMHLLLNMYALLYIGVLLEPRLGRARFLTAYLLTGLAASISSMWWHDTTVSAGASGAIFGLYGVFLAMLMSNLIDKATRKPLLTSILLFVGYNLLNGMKGGIDNAAHLGGLISGLIIGYAFIPSLKRPDEQSVKQATIALLSVLVLGSSFLVYRNMPNDLPKYDEQMKQFTSMESMALEVYSLPKGTPNDRYLYELKNRGIYYWNENIKILDKVDKYSLPDVIRTRDKKLREYCELRIRSYELIAKAIEENTDKYKDEIAKTNQQIADMLESFKGKAKK